MENPVVLEGVGKKVKGRVILDGVSFSVPQGSVYLLAGPNGAGKTTTIRVLLGLMRRDNGRVSVLGVDPESEEWNSTKLKIGYLPEDAQLYDRLTGLENIRFYASVYSGGSSDRREELVERAVSIAGLPAEALERRASAYSRGMKRRLLLAITLMHDPKVAVLDEPTSGLDVFSSYRVKWMIRSMAKSGVTFLVTTHDLREAEELATHVAFISNGRIVYEGTPSEAMEEFEASSLEEAFVRAFGDGNG